MKSNLNHTLDYRWTSQEELYCQYTINKDTQWPKIYF